MIILYHFSTPCNVKSFKIIRYFSKEPKPKQNRGNQKVHTLVLQGKKKKKKWPVTMLNKTVICGGKITR